MPRTEPPQHLSPAARKLWIQLQSEYDLGDAAATALLEVALVAYDRCQEARKILRREGVTIIDKKSGRCRAHPAAAIERDSAKTFTQTLRLLNLDVEPLAPKAGRQPGDRGTRHAYETPAQTSRTQ